MSLHSPFDEERLKIMTVQQAYPFKAVIAELKKYDFGLQRRISFEYIFFKNLNDSPAHSKELARLLKGLDCRVNLIRFHTIPGSSFEGVGEKEMEAFRDALNNHSITATVRASRGQDIYAACGLLSTLNKG